MEMPERINPGSFAARVTFFAPVSLLFFLTVMVIAGATSGPAFTRCTTGSSPRPFRVPPAARVPRGPRATCTLAFAIAALTSVALVVTYVRAIAGATRLVLTTGGAEIVFLVLFSYAFFLEGFTGVDDHDWRDRHAVRADADHGPRSRGTRCSGRAHGCRTRRPGMPRVAEAPAGAQVRHLVVSVVTRDRLEFVDITPALAGVVEGLGCAMAC